jgi:hypothetical protein
MLTTTAPTYLPPVDGLFVVDEVIEDATLVEGDDADDADDDVNDIKTMTTMTMAVNHALLTPWFFSKLQEWLKQSRKLAPR